MGIIEVCISAAVTTSCRHLLKGSGWWQLVIAVLASQSRHPSSHVTFSIETLHLHYFVALRLWSGLYGMSLYIPPPSSLGLEIRWVNQLVLRELVLTAHWLQDKNPSRKLVLTKNLI